MALIINGFRMGRISSLQYSTQASPRPVVEIGSDRAVEFTSGVKMYQGSMASVLLRYGDMVKRLGSVAGAIIDRNSLAATLTNFPEFDIGLYRRGTAGEPAPTLYAPSVNIPSLAGAGGLVQLLRGCIIASADIRVNAQETMIMSNVSFNFVDSMYGNPGV